MKKILIIVLMAALAWIAKLSYDVWGLSTQQATLLNEMHQIEQRSANLNDQVVAMQRQKETLKQNPATVNAMSSQPAELVVEGIDPILFIKQQLDLVEFALKQQQYVVATDKLAFLDMQLEKYNLAVALKQSLHQVIARDMQTIQKFVAERNEQQALINRQLQQIDQALNYITQHAEKYQLNPQQLYLAGNSAGANLASHYAALLSNPAFAQQSNLQPTIQHKQLKGLILHCGIYDLKAFVETAPDEMNIVEWGVYNLVQAYTGDRKQDSEFLKNILPIQHLTANYPAVFISGGNKDFLTETQSMPMLHALQQQQIPVTTAFYPDTKAWLIHEYQFFMHQKESQQTFAKTVEFIGSTADPNVSRIQ